MALIASDRQAITDLINMHGHLTDRGAFDRMDELFTPDAEFDLSDFGLGVRAGLAAMNDAIQAAMTTAGPTEFADQYFRTTPRFETGDSRYAWLNQAVFIGEGRLVPGFAVEYRVYRAT